MQNIRKTLGVPALAATTGNFATQKLLCVKMFRINFGRVFFNLINAFI